MAFTLTARLNILPPSNLNQVVNQVNAKLKKIRGFSGTGAGGNGGIFNINPQTQRQLNGLNTSIKNISKNTAIARGTIEDFGRSASQSIKRFAGFTVFASTFFTLTRAIRSSLTEAIDFQRELVKIRQVTGTSTRDLTGLVDQVTALSTGLGVSSKKILNVAQTLAQAGYNAKEVEKALEALAKTEVAPTFGDIADTTEAAIASMAQFKIKTEDLEKALGSINAVAAKFAVESNDITVAIKRSGATFAAAGDDLNKLTAIFTAIRATTRESAETIATGLRTIGTRLQRTRTIEFLDNLGIHLRDTNGQFVGVYESARRLNTALSKLPNTDPRFAQIIEELGGFRQVNKVIPLIKEFALAEQAYIVAQRGANSLTKDAASAQEALAIRITKVHEEFQALIRTLSGNRAFQEIANSVLALSSSLIKLTSSLEPVLPLLTLIGGIGIAKAAPKFFSGFSPGIPRFASGGYIGGNSNGDNIPSLLSSGEYVLNKRAVGKIGKHNLDRMNSDGVKRFAKGGSVGGVSISNGSVLGGLGLAIIPGLLGSFSKLDNETEKLIDLTRQLGGTFGTLIFALRGSQSLLGFDKNNLQGLKELNKSSKGKVDILQGSLAERIKKKAIEDFEVNNAQNQVSTSQSQLFSRSGNLGNTIHRAGRVVRSEQIRQAQLQNTLSANNGLSFTQGAIIQQQIALSKQTQNRAARIKQQAESQLSGLQGSFKTSSETLVAAKERQKLGQTEEKSIKRQLTTQTKAMAATDKLIARQELLNTSLNTFNIGLAAASAIAISFGDSLERAANAELQQGVRGGRGNFATGRALKTAGTFASVGGVTGSAIGGLIGAIPSLGVGAVPGAIVGGGIGTAIGAGVGGITGHIQGTSEANRIIDKVTFEKQFSILKKSLDNVISGRSTSGSQIGNIVGGVAGLRNRLRTANVEDKETVQGQIGDAVVGIQNFIKEVTKNVKSFDELQRIVGTDTLEAFSTFVELPFDKVRQELEEQIKGQKTAIALSSALNAEEVKQLARLRQFNLLTAALQDSVDSLKLFSSQIDKIEALATGSGSRTSTSDISGIFGRTEGVVDRTLLTNAVRQTTSGFGGRANDIGKEFLQTAEVLNKLPDILIDATKKPFGEANEFVDEFKDAIKAAFPDISQSIVQTLTANILKFRGEEGKDAKIVNELRKNPSGFSKQVSEGVLANQSKFFEENSKLLTQQINDLGGLYEKRRNIEIRLIESLSHTVDLTEQKEEFAFTARNSPIPLGVSQRAEAGRFNAIGIAGIGGGTPAGIGAALIASQNVILKKNVELQTAEFDKKQQLLKEIEEEESKVQKLNKGLEFFRSVTERTAGLQRELEHVQKGNQARFDFTKSFVFGDIEERRNLSRGALGGGLLARGGDINSIPGSLRGGALSFLEQFGDTKLGFLGGKSGRDVIKTTIENSLVRSGRFTRGEASEIALNKTTPAEQKLIDAINSKFDDAIKATDITSNLLKDGTNKILTEIEINTKNFSILLEKNLLTAEKTTLESKANELRGGISGANASFSTLNKIRDLAPGLDFDNIRTALPRLSALQSSKTDVSAQAKILGSLTSFTSPTQNKGVNLDFILGNLLGLPVGTNKNAILTQDQFTSAQSNFSKRFGAGPRQQVFNQDFDKQLTLGKTSVGEFAQLITNRVNSLVGENEKKRGENTVQAEELATQLGFKNPSQLSGILSGVGKLTKLFDSLPKDATFEGLNNANNQAAKLAAELSTINAQLGVLNGRINGLRPIERKAMGGLIGGYGNTDSVPAMLTPGEFVLNRGAVASIGIGRLNRMNRGGIQRFADGGSVGGAVSISPSAIEAFSRFGETVNRLSQSLDSFPRTVEMSVHHTVEVIHNGAQMFSNLTPMVMELVAKTTGQALNKMLKTKFPEVGPISESDISGGMNSLLESTG